MFLHEKVSSTILLFKKGNFMFKVTCFVGMKTKKFIRLQP